MAFCPQCGSDVKEEEAFCSLCGFALNNPVLENLETEDDTRTGEDMAEAGSPDRETGSVGEGSAPSEVPDDEFVDISALSSADESELERAPAEEEPGETPGVVPEDEFVDISALKSEEPEPAEPAPATTAPEPPVPSMLESTEIAEKETVEPASEPTVVDDAERPSSVVTPGDEILQTPLSPPPAVSEVAAEPEVMETAAAEEPAPETPAEPEVMETAAAEEPTPETPTEPKAMETAAAEEPASETPTEPEAMETAAVEVPAPETPSEPEAMETAAAEVRTPETPAEPGVSGKDADETSAGDKLSPETEEQPVEGEPAAIEEPPAEAAAEESDEGGEDSPDFLEDQTLISMPVPDIGSVPSSPSSLKEEVREEKRAGQAESVGEASAAASAASEESAKDESLESPGEAKVEETVQTSADNVEHHLDGEDTLDKEDSKELSGSLPEPPESAKPAEASDEDQGGSSTTPNIGKGDTAGGRGPKLQPLTEGTVLNSRYEIVRKIGGGGMGAVYLASDKNLGGVLRAVKEMVQSYIEEAQQEKAVQDFKRESMLLTSLEHPSIPTIYDYFFDEGAHRFYLVMKYISGGDLAARLRAAPDGKLDEQEVTEWAIQIADVLDYLHNRQPPIVYRDLKPANIMLDGNSGKVMLIDFGIARWINKEEKGVTAVGTMGYAPPELFSGNVVPSSDIYSLGSTVFHLLTGADPQNNPLLIFDFEKNPRPRQINPRISDQIESILMRSVEYNAEKRFTSAAEMRDALTDHLAKLNAGNVTYGVSESPASAGFSDQTVFCGFCGQKIVATDMFCAFCGAKQPLAQPGVQSQEYIPVKLTAKLLIEGTSQLDYPSFDLAKDENLVGRRDPMSNIFPEVDLSKFDPQTKISRKHARIWRDGENFMLEDLGSSNGTMLIHAAQEPMRLAPHQAHALTHGDKIKLGDTMLHFVIAA